MSSPGARGAVPDGGPSKLLFAPVTGGFQPARAVSRHSSTPKTIAKRPGRQGFSAHGEERLGHLNLRHKSPQVVDEDPRYRGITPCISGNYTSFPRSRASGRRVALIGVTREYVSPDTILRRAPDHETPQHARHPLGSAFRPSRLSPSCDRRDRDLWNHGSTSSSIPFTRGNRHLRSDRASSNICLPVLSSARTPRFYRNPSQAPPPSNKHSLGASSPPPSPTPDSWETFLGVRSSLLSPSTRTRPCPHESSSSPDQPRPRDVSS